MAIKFACEACGAKLAAKDGAEGRTIKCPKCGAMIGVPAYRIASPIIVEPDESFGPIAPQSPKPKVAGPAPETPEPMAISFACESCGAKLKEPAGKAGRIIHCPACRREIEVPSAFYAQADEDIGPMVPLIRPGPSAAPVHETAKSAPKKPFWRDPVSVRPPEGGHGDNRPRKVTRLLSLAPLAVIGLVILWAIGSAMFRQEAVPGHSDAAAPVREESHVMDPNHPDYGGIIRLALLRKAGKKIVPEEGSDDLTNWFSTLTRNELDCELLNRLCLAASLGSTDEVTNHGMWRWLPRMIKTLNEDVVSPAALVAAAALAELPQGRPPDPYGGFRDEVLKRVGKELKPLTKQLDKDLDHYLYWRWRDQGEYRFFGPDE